ncbi:AraC family transcriptional regulator [Weissella thailandensis]|uniref:AraC family transcriptional regulator n=2 Tax=Weissella thailandensis TaxID=89061 RepID=A0ABX9I5C4_9LACO|nr:helix-turn-helix domain-containing protein [Weissella thailandensis]NKY90747.1 helix-turn-helix transcriptional regulator [Weissella thailandensis]RDS59853.1 AraC family transcriptional regulator [Weissella thailandensis]GEP74313.1 putative HTH-type transcriptional regulator YisR [Weissella thailandensis]
MLFSTFTLDKTMLFYKGGEFISNQHWQHKQMFHQGDYEVIICIKGPIYLEIEQQHVTLNAHDVLVIPPFTPFGGFRKSDDLVDFYWLHFFSQYKEKIFTSTVTELIDHMQSVTDKHQKIALPRHFTLENDQQILILVHQMLSINNQLSYIDERDYLTSTLLIYLFKEFLSQNQTDERSKINYIKEWIRVNISATLSVAEISTHVHLNPDYLTRLFKKYTGMTTLQYLNHLKIEVASLLLIRTEMSIKQIATAAYFTDPKVFAHKFKSTTSLSPTDYRKSYRLVHQNNPHIDPQIPIPKRIEDILDYIPENGDLPDTNTHTKRSTH